MRIILFIIQKEFIQVLRNKMMIPIIFLLPVVQLVILVHAATFEMKHIDVCIADQDLSSTSRRLAGKFEGSRFFAIKSNVLSFNRAQEKLKNGTAELIIHIPSGFEKKLQKKISAKDNKGDIQFIVNAINGRAAGLINAYAQNVLIDFNKEIITDWFKIQSKQLKNINIEYSYWYNPELDYKKNMLPGILVILTTVVGMFLTAINLVREKEMGTAEQINVTPIKKYQFIMGKLIPFLIIAYIELSIGLFLGVIF